MADAAVTFLMENAQKLIVEEASLILGEETAQKTLQDELDLMRAFFLESANKQGKGQVLIQLEKRLREAMYETEDTLDACLMQKAKGSGAFGRKNVDLAKKTQLLREDNVVGFADEEATLIKYLKQPTEELDVISIVGMPGLGKTTLAWKIYRDPNIQFEFPTLIWVYVSQEFNARDVYLSILKKFTHQDMSTKDTSELIQLVRSHLDRGRFLLFMDDVWTVADWKQIEVALPKNNKLGKVLITSRYEIVATQANRKREPHKLRFLHFEESWELLQLEVFGRNNTCPQELEELGKQIATQYCGGVPLAVVVMGGILVEKCADRRDLWEKVSDSVSAYLGNDKEKRTENIISLSYNKLPHDMRECFLYLGMFPANTEISAWKLTRLWIAEGFIQANMGRSLEEVAENKLNDLVARNLVMVEKTKANGEVKACRIHDMIRDFCQNEAAFGRKNLFQEVRKMWEGVFDPAISEIVKRRRLCIHSNVIEFLRKKPKGITVRSFVCFSKETITLSPEYTSSIPEAFNLLRVIDVNPINFTKFPLRLTKLMHLKYIALSGNEFRYLPEAVSKLLNLQTIKIDTTSREFEIKVDISKMMQLRHFKTKAVICLKELKGGGGENLQTLSRLSANSCREDLFNRASNLKNLGIRGNLTNFVNTINLGKLERLEKLKLVHDVYGATAGSALHRVPDQHSFPPNLRILTLSSTYLAWQHMTTLGCLHKLEVLKLKQMAFKGRLWEAKGSGFPHLESLHIVRTDLEIWTTSDDPFPKLKNLVLKNSERLQEIPSQVTKSLQLLEIKKEKQQIQDGQVRDKKGGFKLKVSHALPSSSSTTN